ncbi:MAG: hypothetical protein HQL32_02175 [Planctomycetes bacterium]|nr:hypothetical protein [Planctomycetota bacterium]
MKGDPYPHWPKFLSSLTLWVNALYFLDLCRAHILPWFWGSCFIILAWRLEINAKFLLAFWGGISIVWLIYLVFTALRSRFKSDDILRDLDESLHLHHALHCAEKGLVPWPGKEYYLKAKSLYRIDFAKLFNKPILGCLFLLLAYCLPLPEKQIAESVTANPWAMEEIETWLEDLSQDPSLEQEQLEEWAKELNELANTEDISSELGASALHEATDRLKEELESSLSETQMTLQDIQNELNALLSSASGDNTQSSELLKNLSSSGNESLAEGAQSLQISSKRLQELLEKAKELQLSWKPMAKPGNCSSCNSLSSSNTLTPRKMCKSGSCSSLPSIQESLKISLANCSSCLGIKPGNCSGSKPGKGGVSRGRGDAPLQFGNSAEALSLANLENLPQNTQMELGEKLKTSLVEPEKTKDSWENGRGGGVVKKPLPSSGVVWKQRLRPEEKKVLYRMK